MKHYTVQKLARLAGVSIRTLHHYDQIGLLKPSSRSAAGYRQYTENELLRLQQILFFRELDFPLEQIGQILDNPDFEPVKALRSHRRLIEQKVERLSSLLITIDKTIQKLKGEKAMSTDEELYRGFSPEQKAQFAQYAEEARKKYDPRLVDEVNKRVSKWSKEKWDAVKKEGDDILKQLAKLRTKPVGVPAVQSLEARHHAYVANFFVASAKVYNGLGQLYVQDDRFRRNFDKYGTGLVDFLQKAIEYYCKSTLSRKKG